MAKNILITEKPSVAMEFAKVLNINTTRKDGYMESNEWIITWCVGHLVTMSYPEKYDEKLKFWRLDTLPFIPKEYKYEVIPNVQKQYLQPRIFLLYPRPLVGFLDNLFLHMLLLWSLVLTYLHLLRH